jgi:hypothetical protein
MKKMNNVLMNEKKIAPNEKDIHSSLNDKTLTRENER